jgi:hypothetical protein
MESMKRINDGLNNGLNDDLNNDLKSGLDDVFEVDPAFDEWIAKRALSLNEPNATPHAEMWNAIQTARATARDAQAGRIEGVTPLHRKPWFLMSAVAAALLLGVGIDRLLLQRTHNTTPTVASTPAPADTSDPARLYRLAAEQTLTQAEALLTAYRAGEARRNPDEARQLGRWGRDVLGSTRLLIDSPAGGDPRLRALLEDLELILVQIIQLSGAPLEASERDLIDRALEERHLLPRIRSAVPPTSVGSVSSD